MVLCKDILANKNIGFAHEVGEDRITRRQLFCCDDDAAKQCNEIKKMILKIMLIELLLMMTLVPTFLVRIIRLIIKLLQLKH